MFAFIDRLIAWIARALAIIAGIALVAIAFIILAEVVMRSMRTPLVGGIELIRVTFVISVFFAFAHVIVIDREIRVDVLRPLFPKSMQQLLDSLSNLVSAAFFAILLWFALVSLRDALARGGYLEGRLLIPMWIPWATIALGSALATLAGICAAIKQLPFFPRDETPAAGL